MSEATVIISTYNRPEAVKDTLDSLEEMETEIGYDVLIVDDSDNEETRETVQSHDLGPKYIRPEKSKNLPHARNVGIEKAETDIVAFVDDDVRFYDRWLDAIVTAFKQNEGAGAVGGPALEFENDEPKDPILEVDENQNIVIKSGFVRDKSTTWIPSRPVKTDTLRGANMSFRKSALKDIEGFDEGYIGNSFREDTDVNVRLKEAGYDIIYHPEAQIEHLYLEEGGCRDKSKDFWYSLGYNQRRFLEKNFSEYKYRYILNFLIRWDFQSYSLMKILLSTVKNREPERIQFIKGFIDAT